MDADALYIRVGRLIECMPDLANVVLNTDTLKWFGDAYAVAEASGDVFLKVELKSAIDNISRLAGYAASASQAQASARIIQTTLYRILFTTELKASAAVQSSFIPAGNSFDAISAISKVLNKAQQDILIVDPYLDHTVLTDFAVLVQENVLIRLLADQKDHKPSLEPSFQRWVVQHGSNRRVQLRLAPARTTHDRLIIIDHSEVWILTQSLNAFAHRAPASLVLVNPRY